MGLKKAFLHPFFNYTPMKQLSLIVMIMIMIMITITILIVIIIISLGSSKFFTRTLNDNYLQRKTIYNKTQ